MQEKKIAILQSNYIPWKGYFDIINSVDEFIIYDEVQYTKNDWRNRNKIKTSAGVRWLTIPVFHGLSQTIDETRVTNNLWRKKHWATITQNYGKAPYFSLYKDIFGELYSRKDTLLSRINYSFITVINEMLGVRTKISLSTSYPSSGDKTDRLVQICRQTEATEYVSGPSARNYIAKEAFASENIRLTWFDYAGYRQYPQRYPPFEHAVSIIDLIFNTGPEVAKYMKSFGKNI
jgi:hypothetical protein